MCAHTRMYKHAQASTKTNQNWLHCGTTPPPPRVETTKAQKHVETIPSVVWARRGWYHAHVEHICGSGMLIG